MLRPIIVYCRSKVLQNAPRGAFCNTFGLHYATICHYKIFVLSFFEWPFYTGLTVYILMYYTKFGVGYKHNCMLYKLLYSIVLYCNIDKNWMFYG